MKLIIKKLQGGECVVEVEPWMTITEIKNQVSEKLKIPVEEQKLLFLGRTLIDEQMVLSYPALKDGSKLNLIVKKPEKPIGLYDVIYKHFKKLGFTDIDASAKAKKFVQVIEEKFKLYSWDDIERLAEDCMREEYLSASDGLSMKAFTGEKSEWTGENSESSREKSEATSEKSELSAEKSKLTHEKPETTIEKSVLIGQKFDLSEEKFDSTGDKFDSTGVKFDSKGEKSCANQVKSTGYNVCNLFLLFGASLSVLIGII